MPCAAPTLNRVQQLGELTYDAVCAPTLERVCLLWRRLLMPCARPLWSAVVGLQSRLLMPWTPPVCSAFVNVFVDAESAMEPSTCAYGDRKSTVALHLIVVFVIHEIAMTAMSFLVLPVFHRRTTISHNG